MIASEDQHGPWPTRTTETEQSETSGERAQGGECTRAHLRRELLEVGDELGELGHLGLGDGDLKSTEQEHESEQEHELGHLGLGDGYLALAVQLAGDAMKLAREGPGPARDPMTWCHFRQPPLLT